MPENSAAEKAVENMSWKTMSWKTIETFQNLI